MKLPIPSPAIIYEKPYSLLDMVRHITGNERRYNQSADDARSGARFVAAIAAAGTGSVAEVEEADLRKFADVVERPNCGWGRHEVDIPYLDPRTGESKSVKRKANATTIKYLPLIDTIADAAKSLPPLPTTK